VNPFTWELDDSRPFRFAIDSWIKNFQRRGIEWYSHLQGLM
jgi:hypothetical protein